MTENNLFHGKLVRLCAEDSKTVAESFAKWDRAPEYMRLLDSGPSRFFSEKGAQEWIEKELLGEKPDQFFFMIRSLEDDRLIGEIGLDGVSWKNGDTFVGIGIGDEDYLGKGYGTDAMRILLRYAFTELNLNRVSLNVFEYNTRAVRSYEKSGFVVEGSLRSYMKRDGRRWDLIYMGILKSEWKKLQGSWN